MLLTIFLKIPHHIVEVKLVLMMMLLVLKNIQSALYHCGGVHGRRKNNTDKDNLDGSDDGRQINQNGIWKETDEVEEDDERLK